jgi:hypothetical protein
MAINRIAGHLKGKHSTPLPPKSAANGAAPSMPMGPGNSSVPSIPLGFVFFPPQLSGFSAWQQEIYRLAYERAKAQLQIPRHHRQLFCVWN